MNRPIIALLLAVLSISGQAQETSSNLDAWLTSSLYGNDNDMAALRRATIERTDTGYRANIRNQFNFACDLAFDQNGDPALLSNCRSLDPPSPICNPDMPDSACALGSGCFRTPDERNPDCFESWTVHEAQVPLRCHTRKAEVVCTGRYTLGTTRGFTSQGQFTLARRLR